MALTDSTTGYAGTSVRAGHFFDTVRARISQELAYRATLNELRNLSQRELADMGIEAGSLKYVARKAHGLV
ncbi:DUF1127 domain-containing protein [Oceanomicrobium pacificus]|uniref:DUF1127 domain-containing protein n=1 Tax=Oceanomicrobium pacificus TaxID=2692916 RepID=A0A6B0THK6_9RHOB|nr:DUF1127 domain-containing protein [Oceanomicrobium pacificus]MXU63860.1 DUF1127 domain-containing protein [Oceanomicrobium pacificus]